MKKLEMMKGLMAGKQMKQHLADGGMSLQNYPGATPMSPFGQGALATTANLTSALSTNPAAANIGLAAPTNIGAQFQQGGGSAAALQPAYQAGAQQGAGTQAQLAGMLMNEAQGGGPNPAQAMLNQATGQNMQQQAALMAGQRGAGANPALIAQLAARQGANIQQQAAGQAATLGAQQQLAAQNEAALIAAQQQAAQQNANQQNIQAQSSINQLLGQQQGLRAAQLGGVQQGLGASMAVGAQGTSNGNPTPSTAPSAADQAAQSSYSADQAGSSGGIYASGGVVGPRSMLAQRLTQVSMAKGGKVPAKVSPGEIYLPPQKAKEVAKGKASPKDGQKIPGKAKVSGDSLKNDTVDKTLEAGGVVVPRTKAKDMEKAAAFVRAVMAKHRR